jgi:hypothetical protein
MAFVVANRVQQTATANTTVSFTLTGTVTGFRTFASLYANNDSLYYCATDATGQWEVGEGIFLTSGPTLTRNVVYDSSNSFSAVTFVGTVTVFVTYPAEAALLLDPLGNLNTAVTIPAGSVWNGSTIGVAYGGTGVTSSSGANSVVLRNASQNVTFNNFIAGAAATTAAAGTTTLTAASARTQILVGSTTQTFQLPNATTLTLGHSFIFVNNSSGNLTVVDNASAVLEVVPPGGITQMGATSVATSAGTWGPYSFIPAAVNWGTNTLNLATTVISGGTWQGGTIGTAYGGTGLTTFAAANNAIYSTSASALAAGTLPVLAGGTGVTTSTGTGSVVLSAAPSLTGAVTIGSTTGTDTITLGRSADAQTVNIGNGANTSATKSINIGTNGGGGATNIIIGTGTGTSTTTLNGVVRPNALTASLPVFTDASKNLVSTGTVPVANGGTGASTYTANGVLYGNGTSAIGVTAAGTTGQVLVATTGAAPSWGTASSAVANGTMYENSLVISANYTLTAGKNAMSVGPITINAGVAVTVPSGQRWVVL